MALALVACDGQRVDVSPDEWAIVVGEHEFRGRVHDLVVDRSASIYLGGYVAGWATLAGGLVSTYDEAPHAWPDMLLARLSSGGKLTWIDVLGSTCADERAKVLALAPGDEGVLATGPLLPHDCSDAEGWHLGDASVPDRYLGHYVALVDANGKVRSVADASDPYDEADVVAVGPGGGMIAAKTAVGRAGELADGVLTVTRLDEAGGSLWTARATATPVWSLATGASVDAQGNAYVVGGLQTMPNGAEDSRERVARFGDAPPIAGPAGDEGRMFVTRLTPEGRFEWALGVDVAGPTDVAIDESGAVIVAGGFAGAFSIGEFALRSRGGVDAFVFKLDAAGKPLWATSAGGPGDDFATAVATGEGEHIVVAGTFEGAATFGPHSLEGHGERNLFVWRLKAN